MTHYNDGHPPDHPAESDSTAVILPFDRATARKAPPEHYLTNTERSELRAMLEWYRDVRPKLEAIMQGCPTAKREISALLRGD